ncbi:zinc-ribbon domain-containing protein [Lactiplantibacillus daowaiensis]|uniref:Zinc-ribbon domain-containing protein n=1 Tax=Lactiplantibacillus daowaiensis TaxID=2559918 RepID=A0ABW1S1V8_9LACO|nr:zinc ribbon domain-containing protein [Lactiplantibacillus daowaiensis]
MKFCIKCGQQLAAETQFCTNCGAEQPDATTTESSTESTNETEATSAATETPQRAAQATTVPDDEESSRQMKWLIIGIIVALLVAVGGAMGYQTYKRNHLTEQDIADIGYDVATNSLGDDITVYYDKTNNNMDIVAKSGSSLYNRADDVVNGYISAGRLTSYVGKFKKISTEMAKKMPTDSRDVRVRFMNPENTNRYLYITQNGDVTYDFTKDDD